VAWVLAVSRFSWDAAPLRRPSERATGGIEERVVSEMVQG
jgi:hypothetical protein